MSGTYNHRWSSGVNEVLPVQRCRRAVQREDHGRDRGRGPREGRGTRQEGARGRPDRLEDARRLRAEPDPRRVPGQRAVTTALSTWWYVGWASALVVVLIAAGLLLAIIGLGRRIVRQADDVTAALDGTREHTTPLFDVTRTNLAIDRITRGLRGVRTGRPG